MGNSSGSMLYMVVALIIIYVVGMGIYQGVKYIQKKREQARDKKFREEKAEGKYLAVAVSSIIARNLFLENLDKLSQEVGYTLPSGAGAKSDQVATKLLQAYGDQALQATAKYHFANTKKAYQRLK